MTRVSGDRVDIQCLRVLPADPVPDPALSDQVAKALPDHDVLGLSARVDPALGGQLGWVDTHGDPRGLSAGKWRCPWWSR
jgi:hypothetical protein